MNLSKHVSQLLREGYSIVPEFYSESEMSQISGLIAAYKLENSSVLKSKELFAIRQLLNEIPELRSLIFNENLNSLIREFQSDNEYFLSKAIYFDKPKDSNWFVTYHQDLTINVSKRTESKGFVNWTNKRGQLGVQPPTEYLNRTITVRIHLDETDNTNGALRVIPKSHTQGVIRTEVTKNLREVVCDVKRGGVMLMKPLTFHASRRSSGKRNRRVVHLELCDKELPSPLQWKERQAIKASEPGIQSVFSKLK